MNCMYIQTREIKAIRFYKPFLFGVVRLGKSLAKSSKIWLKAFKIRRKHWRNVAFNLLSTSTRSIPTLVFFLFFT